MAETNETEKMLQQVAEILRLIQDNRDKPFGEKMTADLKGRLDALKEVVAKFTELNKKAFDAAGLKESDLERLVKTPSPNLSEKERKLLDFSKKLRQEAETIQAELAMNQEPQGSIYEKDKTPKAKSAKAITERKKKFKKLGGDNWLPL